MIGVIEKIKKIRSRYFDRFIFIHINKTGGSSIEKALNLPFEHKTALEKIEEIGLYRWGKKVSFTVVRNPWDKVVSHYHYRVQTNQTGMGDGHIEFNEWVKKAYGEKDRRYYDQPRMFMPQVDWICDRNGKILVNRILRFEKLTDDFNALANEMNVVVRLPHVKKSKRKKDMRQYYDEESVLIISDLFSADIKTFGYKFE